MGSLVNCLAVEHSWFPVLASAFVAFVGGYLTIGLSRRIRNGVALPSLTWLFLSGFVGGATLWCADFIAMLGYRTALPGTYDPLLTFVSLGLVILTTIISIFLVQHSGSGPLIEIGGVVFGLGIVLMHYVGMKGVNVPARLIWSPESLVVSMIAGAAFGLLCFSSVMRWPFRHRELISAFFFLLAVSAVHYISLSGLAVVPDPAAWNIASGLSRQTMVFFTVQAFTLVFILGFLMLVLDIRSKEVFNARLYDARAHDAVTGLPNRWAFGEKLTSVVEAGRAQGSQFALLFFDIYRFREINDVHGHAAGDFVLSVVTKRLVSCLVDASFLARAGNDEFMVLLENYQNRSDVVKLVRRINADVERPILWNDGQLSVRLHAGCAFFPADGRVADQLIACVDVALQRSKKKDDLTVAFYNSELDRSERHQNALALDMRRALSEGEFQLYYQQLHVTADQSIFGFEVLLRWFHKDFGFIGPDEFIPLAERTGFIITLGEWVLHEACADAAKWTEKLQIGVNVAPQQLADPRFPQIVERVLLETGLDPQRLELEITETGIIEDFNRALETIRTLKAIGVKIAMDDFGTGYSSLAMLQHIPFDKIKIDRSFVDGLPGDELSAAIVRSTVIIGKSLGIRVLAEGVENREQLEFLIAEHCMRAQGYYFGKPMPRKDIEHYVNGHCQPTDRCCSVLKP